MVVPTALQMQAARSVGREALLHKAMLMEAHHQEDPHRGRRAQLAPLLHGSNARNPLVALLLGSSVAATTTKAIKEATMVATTLAHPRHHGLRVVEAVAWPHGSNPNSSQTTDMVPLLE